MEDWSRYEPKFRYMMLSRMKQDCDYYLGYGNRSTNHLWAQNEKDQIENMKALWHTFDPDDKPEWLTWDELMDYAQQMDVEIEPLPDIVMYFRKNREDDEVDNMAVEIEYIYEAVRLECAGLDSIYEDYIIDLVGRVGLNALLKHNYLETCGVVNGRQLYVLLDK